ncbi:alpha/beta-hydrolase [Aaosphaeria arxii CBS 175.79]|uniref:Alpha/beta-hydrolase n=1 Tax=Aaosphaeria arxii CBS 175.79 TaxID=1450172 RepID=A0A6A5XF28_9PLEO|nr:alpha/beta-hydrolase [Aaosphaeria arxii CBS 175.79]KAF2010994.1 alpha/beta-hydrolase [Aaosphaeria arxii CBS 175.79]
MAGILKHFYPSNASFGYEALRAVGYSNYGGADIAGVIAICSRIRSGDEESWMAEWKEAADFAMKLGRDSLALGNIRSAEEAFLRASNYYRTADFYRRTAPFDDEISKDLVKLCNGAFLSAMKLTGYPFEEIKIPYQDTTLPGFILRCDANSTPRPTIIFNGGFDSVGEESWFAIAAPALRRGCNILAFDGPGQGRALREQHLFFRHDWENVLTPVVDFALTRPEFDEKKLVLFGWSMGGYLAARATTSEHRFAAVILDDGVFDFGSAFSASVPSAIQYLIRNKWDKLVGFLLKMASKFDTGMRWGLLNGKWTFGLSSAAELFREVGKYNLNGIVEDIVTPTLVLDAPDDHFLKGEWVFVDLGLQDGQVIEEPKKENIIGRKIEESEFKEAMRQLIDHNIATFPLNAPPEVSEDRERTRVSSLVQHSYRRIIFDMSPLVQDPDDGYYYNLAKYHTGETQRLYFSIPKWLEREAGEQGMGG